MEIEVHVLMQHPDPGPPEYPDELPCCPVCGAKPFVHKNVVDGFYMGWSAGCPRYRLFDGIHGHDFNTPEEEHFTGFGFFGKQEAIDWWKDRVKRSE